MKRIQMYGMTACVAVLATAGCGGGGSASNVNLPAASAIREALGRHTSGTIAEYSIPHPGKNVPKTFPVGIETGPDGALWFTERGSGKIGRITTAGVFTEPIRLHGRARFPWNLATGPDGYLWVTGGSLRTYRQESRGAPDPYASIWQVSLDGTVKEVPLPMYSDPRSIALGPDGNYWFGEHTGNIGRITTSGLITQFPVPHGNPVNAAVIVGPDGALWFGETFHNKLGRITTAGKVRVCPVSGPAGIVAGPDGNLWVSEFLHGKVARVTTACAITGEFALSSSQSSPKGIVVGSDGDIYVAEFDGGKIGKIDLSTGLVTEYPIPTPNSGPWGITSGPDGNIWFAESLVGKIGVLTIN